MERMLYLLQSKVEPRWHGLRALAHLAYDEEGRELVMQHVQVSADLFLRQLLLPVQQYEERILQQVPQQPVLAFQLAGRQHAMTRHTPGQVRCEGGGGTLRPVFPSGCLQRGGYLMRDRRWRCW